MSDNKSNKNITISIEDARSYAEQEKLKLVFTTELSDELIDVVSRRSDDLPTLYFASIERLKKRLKNGCFLLMKGDEVIGHIFAHKHKFRNYFVFERSSLWVHPGYRKYNLGLLLMHELTERFKDEIVISIAKEPKVHRNNELLGMTQMSLSEISPLLVKELEKIGKLRDEIHYKYYVNQYLESLLRRFK